jgi:hypothetical protein
MGKKKPFWCELFGLNLAGPIFQWGILRCFGSPNTELGSRLPVADFSFAIASDSLLSLKLRACCS